MAESKTTLSGRVLRFGVFQVNLAARELRKHGVQVRLPGQPFCILSILLEKPGEVVSREEIREKLWTADVFVDFDHSLNSAMKKLRAALGDSPENSRYIETLPRQGYRFIAPVEEISVGEDTPAVAVPSTPAAEPTPADRTILEPREREHKKVAWIGIALSVAVILAAGSFWFKFRGQPSPVAQRLTMAVLPLENLTGDSAQDYLSDGLTEEITARLGRFDPEHLGVIARTSVMRYKHSQEKASQIARELGVQYLLEGSLRREGDRVRVTTQLIQAKDETPIWSRQYDRQIDSLLALQTEIAQETSDEIQVTLGGSYKPNLAVRNATTPTSYAAYDLYLRGRYFWNRRSEDDFHRAASYFQQSIEKDPNYAPAYAGMADTYALMSSWMLVPAKEYMPKARAAALRALELNDSLAEAHTSLALIAENFDYDWQTAEKEYRRAIALDPQYATAHQWYAECLSFQGRFDEALAESERARQLDPLSLIIATDHAVILYYARQYDRSIEQFRAVREMDPNFPRAHMISSAYLEKGMFAEALNDAEQYKPEGSNEPLSETLALVYARSGDKARARQALSGRKSAGSHSITTMMTVEAMVAMGAKDEAIAALTKGYREHSNLITSMKVEPALDPLRGDARFQDLLRRTGLAE